MTLDFEGRVAAAFVERYIQASQEMLPLLGKFDEASYREYVATTAPRASKYLEARTHDEMSTKLSIYATAVSVAAAISEAARVMAEDTTDRNK